MHSTLATNIRDRGFLTDPDGDFTNTTTLIFSYFKIWRVKNASFYAVIPAQAKAPHLSKPGRFWKILLAQMANLLGWNFGDVPNEPVFARRTFESDAWKQWQNSWLCQLSCRRITKGELRRLGDMHGKLSQIIMRVGFAGVARVP